MRRSAGYESNLRLLFYSALPITACQKFLQGSGQVHRAVRFIAVALYDHTVISRQ